MRTGGKGGLEECVAGKVQYPPIEDPNELWVNLDKRVRASFDRARVKHSRDHVLIRLLLLK